MSQQDTGRRAGAWAWHSGVSPWAPALSRDLGNSLSASLHPWSPARKPIYDYCCSLCGTGGGWGKHKQNKTQPKKPNTQTTKKTHCLWSCWMWWQQSGSSQKELRFWYKGYVWHRLRLHVRAGRQILSCEWGMAPGEIIIEVMYLKADVGTSPQSSSSQLCHWHSEGSKAHGPLRTINTFAVISIDTGCKETLSDAVKLWYWVGNPIRGWRTKKCCALQTTLDGIWVPKDAKENRRKEVWKCRSVPVCIVHPGAREEAEQDQLPAFSIQSKTKGKSSASCFNPCNICLVLGQDFSSHRVWKQHNLFHISARFSSSVTE